MNLDERARQARASLERHVDPDLDLAAARRTLEARSRRKHDDRRRARVGVAVLSALALVGGFMVIGSAGDSDRRPDTGDEMAIDDDSENLTDDAFIEALPQGPTDGKDSWRLPVGVSPQTGLNDGDTVRIYGRGFEPLDSLGVVHCSSEADTLNAGVGGCDLGTNGGFNNVQYVSADANGDVVADVVVHRFITTPGFGQVDCASAAERCLLGMGAVSNYDRSGGAYIDFAGAPPFAQPTFAVTPNQDLAPGQEVQVAVDGWVPGRQIRIEQCVVGEGGLDGTQRCEALLDTRADDAGSFAGTVTVNAAVIVDQGEVACGSSCVLRANGIGVPEGTTAPFPDAVPLAFSADAASVPTTTHPGTTTTPPPVAGNPAGSCEGYVDCTVSDGSTTSVVEQPGTSGPDPSDLEDEEKSRQPGNETDRDDDAPEGTPGG